MFAAWHTVRILWINALLRICTEYKSMYYCNRTQHSNNQTHIYIRKIGDQDVWLLKLHISLQFFIIVTSMQVVSDSSTNNLAFCFRAKFKNRKKLPNCPVLSSRNCISMHSFNTSADYLFFTVLSATTKYFPILYFTRPIRFLVQERVSYY